jgi:hypothetical protein
LVLDLSVRGGEGTIVSSVTNAVNKLLDQGTTDTPSSWGNTEESKIIDAINEERTIVFDNETEANIRENNIANSSLSKGRSSFNGLQNV